MDPSPLAARLAGFGTTIFAEMTELARETGAINLGQGFPDEDGPASVLAAAATAMGAGHNQYAPARGVPGLRAAIAAHQRERYGLELDPDRQVQVTFGATEAIAAALLGLCDPGDPVVTFEPYYDSYAASIAMAGGERRTVPLRLPGWAFDADELRDAVAGTGRWASGDDGGRPACLLLLNSPHNPTGKVFSRAELETVAAVCREHDLVAVCDEVYEHLVFDGEHVPLATLPGMAERTLVVSSAGKAFSVTGWKTGWATGPEALVGAVAAAKQFLSFSGGTPLQHGVAAALALGEPPLAALREALRGKRDRLCDGLAAAGLEVHRPDGTYFATVDVRSVGEEDGAAFCRDLPGRAGVVAVPTSAFYDDPAAGRSLVRFAFCKRDDVIDDAAARLAALG